MQMHILGALGSIERTGINLSRNPGATWKPVVGANPGTLRGATLDVGVPESVTYVCWVPVLF